MPNDGTRTSTPADGSTSPLMNDRTSALWSIRPSSTVRTWSRIIDPRWLPPGMAPAVLPLCCDAVAARPAARWMSTMAIRGCRRPRAPRCGRRRSRATSERISKVSSPKVGPARHMTAGVRDRVKRLPSIQVVPSFPCGTSTKWPAMRSCGSAITSRELATGWAGTPTAWSASGRRVGRPGRRPGGDQLVELPTALEALAGRQVRPARRRGRRAPHRARATARRSRTRRRSTGRRRGSGRRRGVRSGRRRCPSARRCDR